MEEREKGKKIGSYFPEIRKKILEEAEYLIAGNLILPGSGGKRIFVGLPSKWFYNPTGNFEYTYSLNRMYHLKTLCEAYLVSGEKKYIIRVRDDFENWLENVPPPTLNLSDISVYSECTPWRALEVGSRGINSWPLIIAALKEAGLYTNSLKKKTEDSVKSHMEILYRVSPLLWPKADHNHYLIENMGLLSFSLLFPSLDEKNVYKNHAKKELERCFENQFTPDGGQIEGSPSYHNACLYWFSLFGYMSGKEDSSFRKKLDKMFEYSIYTSRNSGGTVTLGDSHGNDKETIFHPAIMLYLYSKDISYLETALHFASKETFDKELSSNIFLYDDLDKLYKDYKKTLGNGGLSPKLPLYSYQEKLGQVFIRSGFEKDDLALSVICKSPVQNRHSHIDPGSIDTEAFGKVLVIDPGIFTYKEGLDRYNFKSTLRHSTLSVNKKDAWEYLGSFRYGPMEESYIDRTSFSPNLSYASMIIRNYEPVEIRRTVALLDKSAVLILDDVNNLGALDIADSSLNINSLSLIRNGKKIYSNDKGANLLISFNAPEVVFDEGEYSTVLDRKEKSTMVRLRRKGESNFINVTLLLPFKGKKVPDPLFSYENKDGNLFINYENKIYKYKDGEINA